MLSTMLRALCLTLVLLVSVGCGDDDGGTDTSLSDAGADTNVADTGGTDAGGEDTGSADTGGPDTGAGDGVFLVDFVTTAGDFTVEVHPEWAPLGAARFRELVEAEYFDECRFFRVLPGFVAQFGMHGDPTTNALWQGRPIVADPVTATNTRGTLTFAMTSDPDSRTTQLFVNYADNSRLDGSGFAPFGEIIGDGMDAVDAINSEYGEAPSQGQIAARGNEYLNASFPNLDYVMTARIR